ncbi:MAG: hypothetical protein WB783_19190 [Arenicellales bacterium]
MTIVKRGYMSIQTLITGLLAFFAGVAPGLARTNDQAAAPDVAALVSRFSDSRVYDRLLDPGKAQSIQDRPAFDDRMQSQPSQPAGASKLQPVEQARQTLKLKPGEQPRQTFEAWPTRKKARPPRALKLEPGAQPQQELKLKPAGKQPQQAMKLKPREEQGGPGTG